MVEVSKLTKIEVPIYVLDIYVERRKTSIACRATLDLSWRRESTLGGAIVFTGLKVPSLFLLFRFRYVTVLTATQMNALRLGEKLRIK